MAVARVPGQIQVCRLAALAGLAMPLTAAAQQPPRPIAITRVSVVDVRAGRTIPDRLVVISDGRIDYVGDAAPTRIPRGSTVVDGRGRYLIPGLWDMHVHLSPGDADSGLMRDYNLGLLLANGVTGARDMGGNLRLLSAWRDAIRRGDLAGPRLLITGDRLRPAGPVVPGAPFPVRTRQQLHEVVTLLRQGNADHLKIVNLPADLLRATGQEAEAAGLRMVGHLPPGISADSAIDAGYRSIDHAHALLNAASVNEAQVLRRQQRFLDRSRLRMWFDRTLRGDEPPYPMPDPADFRDERLLALAQRSRQAPTWFTPTLRQSGAFWGQPGPLFDRGPAEYRRSGGQPDSVFAKRQPSASDSAEWSLTLRAVGVLHRGGARLLAGSDMPAPWTLPGFGLHDELALLVEAGLTPAAALGTATTAPAEYLSAVDSLGSIAAGYAADLVLLDADPLVDIAATRRIRAVISQGRLLQRPDLDALLARVAVIAAELRSRAAR